jgi:hypothetical protein
MEQNTNENWDFLKTFFPSGWEDKAAQLGALTRKRIFKSPGDLLRLLIIHLSDGCSMRETVARAKQGGLVSVSDVALLKRLRSSSEWFRWLSLELIRKRGIKINPPMWISKYNIKSVDASNISEPGSTGTDWRLHYSMDLFGLRCDQFIISRQETGESFTNFTVKKNDLYIGDRAYGRLKGLKYVTQNGGQYIARLKNKAFKIFTDELEELPLLKAIENLKIGESKDITVFADRDQSGKPRIKMRLCAIRKSDEEAQKAMRKAIKEQKKKQRNINAETIELHRYIILVSSLPASISDFNILELYRTRWQIEIAFKRLKSILGLGHLPKKDISSCQAWLHGKIFVALLAQAVIDEGRFFSPWGYPLYFGSE